jgi:hypothetical protein
MPKKLEQEDGPQFQNLSYALKELRLLQQKCQYSGLEDRGIMLRSQARIEVFSLHQSTETGRAACAAPYSTAIERLFARW